MKNSIHDLISWVKAEGEVKAFERLRLRMLGPALEEGLYWSRIDPSTNVSDAFFAKAREVATEIVGKPYPR